MSYQQSEFVNRDILIVDDVPANLHMLSQMLSEQGYKVRAAISGSRALVATRTAPPDLILLDIRMPEMDGYQVCQQLKADAQTHDIPIIFLSALDEVHDKVRAFDVGGVDYITKPFQLPEVLARVRTHLTLREMQRQLQDANRRFEQELVLAGRTQASLLPRQLPEIPGWQLAVTFKPARQTSGDFYDVTLLPNGHLAMLVGDVADKGAGAALYMALSWTLIRTYTLEYPTQPELVLSTANHRILMDTAADRFVTVFYSVLNPATGELAYCNAGHNPPLLISAQGGSAAHRLTRTGLPLGIFEDQVWERGIAQLASGDALLLYTDGITDAQNMTGDFFGEGRLLESARAKAGGSARDIRDAVVARVDGFTDGAPQLDDIALLVVTRG